MDTELTAVAQSSFVEIALIRELVSTLSTRKRLRRSLTMSDYEIQIEAVEYQKKLFKALLSLKISDKEKKRLCNLAVLAIP